MGIDFDEYAVWCLFVKGDKKQFELIYNVYYQSLINYASKFNLDVGFIEEAIQDLFVKLWNNRATLNQPKSVKHYLFRALKNTIYNKLNLIKKEIYIGNEADLLAFDLSADTIDTDQEYRQALIKELLKPLTQRQKEAVYLYYVEDMTYKEISELLNINIGGTYKLIYRAIAGIKEKAGHFEMPPKVVSLSSKM